MVDRPDWAEMYVREKFYLNDPYLRNYDVYQTGFCFIEQNGTEEFREKILRVGKEFDLDQNVLYIDKSEEAVEFFGFSGNWNTSCLNQIYLNKPWALKSFADHFRKEMAPILQQMATEASPLIDLKGEDFLCKDPIYPYKASELLEKYLIEIGKGEEVSMAKKLSGREKQCVEFLAAGKSAKESAAAMSLSPRTVEFYFENIKNKLSCSTKQEVFELAKRFQELGLIP